MEKSGFRKSLIFQLLLFIISQTCVIFTLMLLKLLQAKQSKIINCLPYEKAIVLNKENNQKHMQDKITQGHYINVFTSPKIALLKKFKKLVLD